jgi:release factor glutamine methyltransferase
MSIPVAVSCRQLLLSIVSQLAVPGSPIVSELHESYAWQLLEAVTQQSRAQLVALRTITLDAAQQEWLTAACRALVYEHKPIQYIIGSVPFLDLAITVQPPYLIPRPETEAWVAALIACYAKRQMAPTRILDLCTGTGCIALALARAFAASGATVCGVDIMPGAVALAAQNACSNNITSTFLCGDLYAPVANETFDLIVANPPYIPTSYRATLERSVAEWEDGAALFGGDDGLDLIRTIVHTAPQYCIPGRPLQVWIEIDCTQEHAVRQLFVMAGFTEIVTCYDAADHPRVVHGIWCG